MTRLITLFVLITALAWGQVKVGGDLSGSSTRPTVVKIQTVPINRPTVTGTSPVYDGTSIVWQTISGASTTTLPWTSITGRPTALSSFTNDTGFITSAGTAAKATALEADPVACPAGQYVYDIDANGTLHCAIPAGTGGSGGTVDWANVTNRPTASSAFTNDAGFITSAGSILGNAATATAMQSLKNPCASGQFVTGLNADFTPICAMPPTGGSEATSVVWTNVTGRPTALSAFTNDLGYVKTSDPIGWGSITGAPTIPTRTSQLINDSGFASSVNIPTKLSQLQNDIGYLLSTDPVTLATRATRFDIYPSACSGGKFALGMDDRGNALCDYPPGSAAATVYWENIQHRPPITYNWPDAGMSITEATDFTSTVSITAGSGAVPQLKFNHDSAASVGYIGIDPDTHKLRTWNDNQSGYADWYAGTIYSNSRQVMTYGSGPYSIDITGSAGSVAWANVSGKPTALSAFTNDTGYITNADLSNVAAASADQWTGTRTLTWTYGGDPNNPLNGGTYMAAWANAILTAANITEYGCVADTGTATVNFYVNGVVADGVNCATTLTTHAISHTVPQSGYLGFVIADGATAKSITFYAKYTPTY